MRGEKRKTSWWWDRWSEVLCAYTFYCTFNETFNFHLILLSFSPHLSPHPLRHKHLLKSRTKKMFQRIIEVHQIWRLLQKSSKKLLLWPHLRSHPTNYSTDEEENSTKDSESSEWQRTLSVPSSSVLFPQSCGISTYIQFNVGGACSLFRIIGCLLLILKCSALHIGGLLIN